MQTVTSGLKHSFIRENNHRKFAFFVFRIGGTVSQRSTGESFGYLCQQLFHLLLHLLYLVHVKFFHHPRFWKTIVGKGNQQPLLFWDPQQPPFINTLKGKRKKQS